MKRLLLSFLACMAACSYTMQPQQPNHQANVNRLGAAIMGLDYDQVKHLLYSDTNFTKQEIFNALDTARGIEILAILNRETIAEAKIKPIINLLAYFHMQSRR